MRIPPGMGRKGEEYWSVRASKVRPLPPLVDLLPKTEEPWILTLEEIRWIWAIPLGEQVGEDDEFSEEKERGEEIRKLEFIFLWGDCTSTIDLCFFILSRWSQNGVQFFSHSRGLKITDFDKNILVLSKREIKGKNRQQQANCGRNRAKQSDKQKMQRSRPSSSCTIDFFTNKEWRSHALLK